MLFRRLFLCALFVGILAGFFDSALQRWQVVPMILAAEAYEGALETAAHSHEDGAAAHSHEPEAWAPKDGLERTAATVLANILNSIGSALLLLALMSLWNRFRGGQARSTPGADAAPLRHGLLWGAAAWFCMFAMPAAGLPPELPGMQAGALQARQLWWLFAVLCGAGGLAVLCLVRTKWRVLGLGLLVLPFAIDAPHSDGSPFVGFEAEAAVQMALLAQRFVMATALASALQWLLLGVLCALAGARWLNPLLRPVEPSGTPAGVLR